MKRTSSIRSTKSGKGTQVPDSPSFFGNQPKGSLKNIKFDNEDDVIAAPASFPAFGRQNSKTR